MTSDQPVAHQPDNSGSASDQSDPGSLAVRRFLEFLQHPESARDDAAIARIEAQLAQTTDVLSRLQLLSELDRAKKVDGAPLLEDFVKHARMWAAVNRVTVSAFRQLGVSPVVLAQAGFDLGNGTIADRARKGKAATPSAPRAPRNPSASSASIAAWMTATRESFTLADAMAQAGGSLMTVKKVAQHLLDEGQLRSLGHIPTPGARGRAPERFERTH
jgi:hypothetical protein